MKKLLLLLAALSLIGAGCIPSAQDRELTKKLKCQEVGEKYQQASLDGVRGSNIVIDSHEIAYSKKLNTCLYFAQWSVLNTPHKVVIVDLLTNKVLAEAFGSDVNKAGSLGEPYKDFYNKKNEWFSE